MKMMILVTEEVF